MIDVSRVLKGIVALSWLGTIGATFPVAQSLRGNFRTTSPNFVAQGTLRPVDGASAAAPVRLDTLSGVILVTSATCNACRANGDNWLKLTADMHARFPGLAVLAVHAPKTAPGVAGVSEAMRSAIPEYQLVTGGVEGSLDVHFLPATVLLQHGRIVSVTDGVLGPRRESRILRTFAAGAR